MDTAKRATTGEAAGIGSGGSTDGPGFILGFVEEKPEVDGEEASRQNTMMSDVLGYVGSMRRERRNLSRLSGYHHQLLR